MTATYTIFFSILPQIFSPADQILSFTLTSLPSSCRSCPAGQMIDYGLWHRPRPVNGSARAVLTVAHSTSLQAKNHCPVQSASVHHTYVPSSFTPMPPSQPNNQPRPPTPTATAQWRCQGHSSGDKIHFIDLDQEKICVCLRT